MVRKVSELRSPRRFDRPAKYVSRVDFRNVFVKDLTRVLASGVRWLDLVPRQRRSGSCRSYGHRSLHGPPADREEVRQQHRQRQADHRTLKDVIPAGGKEFLACRSAASVV